jgi:uncharacterized protein YcbX
VQSTVTRLSTTVVKGTRLRTVEQIELGRSGARGDRRFFVIDAQNRLVNAKQVGDLGTVVADYEEHTQTLSLTFPDGRTVADRVELAETVSARFYSSTRDGRVLRGPLSAALSEFLGQPLRLVAPSTSAIDRGVRGAASLISSASLRRFASAANEPTVDARRFRMLIEIDGVTAHEEDGWVGGTGTIGEARLRFRGHVGRCLITSRDPDTGRIDLPTLDILGTYRRGLPCTEPLPFGIYGEVLREGTIAIGDRIVLVE